MRDIEILAEGDIIINSQKELETISPQIIGKENTRLALVKFKPSDMKSPEKVTKRIHEALDNLVETNGINYLELQSHQGDKKTEPLSFVQDIYDDIAALLGKEEDIIRGAEKKAQENHKKGKGFVVSKDIENARKFLDSKYFPQELKAYAKENNTQFIVMNEMPEKNGNKTGYAAFSNHNSGISTIIVTKSFLKEFAKKKDVADMAVMSGEFAQNVVKDRGVSFSTDSEREFSEMDNKAEKYIQVTHGVGTPTYVEESKRMGFLNHWLNEGDKKYRDVEKNLPENTKTYRKMLSELDRLTEEMQERNASYRQQLDGILTEGKVVDPKEPANTNINDQDKEKPSLGERNPVGFTADQATKTVKELLEDLEPFLKDALATNPPKNRFKADLKLEEKHPITITLADENTDTFGKMLITGIKNLDEAVETKKQLQTIILGRDDIRPYRNIAEDRTVTLGSSEIIPEGKPNSIEVAPESGFYKLKMEYLEGDTRIGVTIPLGVSQQDENKQERANERANEALRFIETQQKIGFSITKSDTELYLKGRVNEGKLEGEWKNPERMLVEGLENKTKVNFSDGEVKGQETEIAKVSIVSKPKLNPTWTADVTILVDGERVKSFAPDLNTSDHMVAQQRAAEYVGELSSRLEAAQGNNPRGWALDEQNDLIKTEVEAGLGSLSLEGVKKLEEQIQRPKVDFSVEMVENPEELGDKARITLGVYRGARANAKEQFVNDKTGKMVEKTFVVPDENAAIEFAVAVDDTFKHYLQEAYSTKTESSTGEELTKTGKRYHPMTSVNLFEDAVRTNLAKFEDVEKSHLEPRSAESSSKGIER